MVEKSVPSRNRSLVVMLIGAVLGLIGLILLIGGIWLAALGGSPYYLLAGLGLIVSGLLLIRGRPSGAGAYGVVYVLTILWALWEVGLNGWALVPRIIAPTVLMILVLLILPLVSVRWRWSAAFGSAAVLVIILFVGGFALSFVNEPVVGALPQIIATTVNDPSPLPAGTDWPAYAGTFAAQRYSPLAQITPANVTKLQRAWTFHSGDLPDSPFTKKKFGAEMTPLKVGNTLYLCTPRDRVVALDPANGHERWRYDPKVPEPWIPYTAACRGVTYYATPGADAASECAGRILLGTLDSRLIALDARTGKPCSGFGSNGAVDTKVGMGRVIPGMLSITSPPTIVKGVVVVGHQVLDGQRRDAPSGVILGYDAVTGAKRWAWDLKNPALVGDPPAGQEYSRGTPNHWTAASGDEALGLVYVPLGNSAVDYLSSTRSAPENAFSSSLVAIDVTTGKPRWRFQTVHKDVWDYDLGSQATLVNYPTPKGPVPALILPSKQGEIYVLDRRTGQSLFPVQERAVPQGGVEPDQRSRTQPYSTFHSLTFPPLGERDMWGMSPIDQMVCRIQYHRADYRGPYTPPVAGKPWIEYPGYNGGSDWGGVALDPVHGVIVANYNDMPNYNMLVPRAEAQKKRWVARGDPGSEKNEGEPGVGDAQLGSPYAVLVNAGWRILRTGLMCKQPPYGGIRAIDLRTGRTIWDRPFGTARANGPFNIPSQLPITIGTPNNGGSVVTAGGVIFIAAATDNLIHAIDLRTGKTLWTDALPGGGQATPMTYEVNGKQYLVIMAGGHHFMETPVADSLIAYALP